MLRMNSIPETIFNVADVADSKMKVNGAELSRKKIVSAGRLVACEAFGGVLNRRNSKEKYASKCDAKGIDYATLSRKHGDQVMLFCAAQANRMIGRDAPESIEEFKKNARDYFRNGTFMATLAAITEDVIRPLIPRMWDDLAGDLLQIHTVPMGGTYEIDVKSNDVFIYEDGAIGAGHSATYQYLYGKTVTLRAESFVAQCKINWFQSLVNGDPGDWYVAFMNGQWNKMYALFMQSFTAAAANTKYLPSGNVYNSYNSNNWANATVKVAALNNVGVEDLIAYGKRTSLMNILPVDGTGSAITGLQYGLGKEWFERGFLPNAGGVSLVESTPVIVPHTQNRSVDMIDLDDNIYIFAKAGIGYAPMQGVMEENTPFTVTFRPDETADFTYDVNSELRFNVIPLFASKGAVIKNV